MKNPLLGQNHIFQIKIWQKFDSKKNTKLTTTMCMLPIYVHEGPTKYKAILLVKSSKLDPRPLEEDPRPIQAMEMSYHDSPRCKLVFNHFFSLNASNRPLNVMQ